MTNFLIAWEDDYWLYLKAWHGSTTNTNILFNPKSHYVIWTQRFPEQNS